MKEVVLSKKAGWITIILLVLLDALLDVLFAEGKGLESNILRPIANIFGISNPLFVTPLVLILIYGAVKVGAWLAKTVDKIPAQSEELLLTTFVIVYSLLDIGLIMAYSFHLPLFNNRAYLIIVLIIAGIAYSWWAEKRIKASFRRR